jgi:hypothetical protein
VRPLRRLVKYFYEKDIEFYRKGQFRFGTLESYRRDESNVQRLNDPFEGRRTLVLKPIPLPYLEGMHTHEPIILESDGGRTVFANNTFTRPILSSRSTANAEERVFGFGSIELAFNAHVLCLTKGEYSKSHHAVMVRGAVNPDGSKYQGDEKLVCAIELNFSLFCAAIGEAISPLTALGNSVEYRNKRENASAQKVSAFLGGQDHDWLSYEAVYLKSTHFASEREFRITLLDEGSPNVPDDAPAKLFYSAALRDSILAFHHFDD